MSSRHTANDNANRTTDKQLKLSFSGLLYEIYLMPKIVASVCKVQATDLHLVHCAMFTLSNHL